MVVLDTSILIDFLDGRLAAKKAIERFADQSLRIAIFTKYELLRGENNANSAKIWAMLKTLNVLDYTEEALDESVRIYKNLRQRGKKIDEIDILIAAISIVNGEELLTNDHGFEYIQSPNITVV